MARRSICYKDPLHVCFCMDKNLVNFLPNVVVSLLRKNKQYALHIHVVVDDTVDIKKIKTLYTKECFPWVCFSFYKKSWSNNYTGLLHVTKTTMVRLYIPELLKSCSKVVYLDVDLVVHCDLVKAFENIQADEKFKDVGIAMKNSLTINYFKSNSSFKSKTRGNTRGSAFSGNCGVMFMDLDLLRKENFVKKCLKLCEMNPKFHDQEIINLYCNSNHSVLSKNLNIYFNQDTKVLEDYKNDFIFHFAGSKKPYSKSGVSNFQYLWSRNNYTKNEKKLTLGILKYTNPDVTKASSNIGDYVQSLAALQYYRKYIESRLNIKYPSFDLFLNAVCDNTVPNVEFVFLERDNMGKLSDHYGYDNIITLMNGWWLHPQHNKLIFEIPENVTPLFISFHLHEKRVLEVPYVDVLRKYQPIGCRDKATLDMLQAHNIDAYFSGCLTVGIDFYKWDSNRSGGKTVYVDVKHNDPTNISSVCHEDKSYKNGECRKMLQTALGLLRRYSVSKNVRTSRLHCFMPCVGMGVPVELTSPKDNKAVTNWGPGQRFKGLVDIVTTENKREFVKSQQDTIFTFIDRSRVL